MNHFYNGRIKSKCRRQGGSWSIATVLALSCLLAGCATFGGNCYVPPNLEGVVYAPTERFYAIGSPTRVEYVEPRSQAINNSAVVQLYEERGTVQRGPDKIHGFLTPEDRLMVTQICRESSSAYDGLVAYGQILTGPLRGKTVSLYGVVTVGNTGVEVMQFSRKMRELQERRDAGEPLDFSYYQVNEQFLMPVENENEPGVPD